MALEDKGPAPYAPTRGVTAFIQQYREKGLPTPITTLSLEKLQIEASLARRTLAALKQLDLLDDDGMPTATLEQMKVVPSAEFRDFLAAWVREAYKPIFTYVDPAEADVQRIRDQFRHYTPQGLQNRMLTLFLGLCQFAGIIDETPVLPRPAAGKGSGGAASPGAQGGRVQRPPAVRRGGSGGRPDDGKPPPSLTAARQRYVDLLLSKAEAGESDADLLDRIERVLGVMPGKKEDSP